MELSTESIDLALPKVDVGLKKYLAIQDSYRDTVVDTDREFQKRFNHFYRVRRGSDWQKSFYKLLEDAKNNDYAFSEILDKLSNSTGRLEASFSSKLLATSNPNKAVLDSVVLKNVGLKLPYASAKNRKERIVGVFNELDENLNKLLDTHDGKYLVDSFNTMYPYADITNIKKLDLVLWQTR